MIYQYTLAPIESILESVFIILSGITGSYFFGLVLLAVVVRLVTKPLEKYASHAVTKQAEIESVLDAQLDEIKQKYTAGQRHEAIKRLYVRYSYHPVYAIRSLARLGVQLPFFIAAYFMLSDFPQLEGSMVPILGDLGKPDTLLFGSIHLMPFIMTLVNVLALVTVPEFSRKNLIQGLFISLVFLALLYESPLALLLYWTASNLFSLISNFTPAISKIFKLKKSKVKFKNTFVGRKFEEYAYLFFVTNLAVLVPLLGVLGEQFNFFTAHSLSSQFILSLLLAISLVPPLILTALRWVGKKVGFAKAFDGVVLFAFLGLFLFYSLNKAGYGLFPSEYEPYILFFLALAFTTVTVVFILKNKLLRNLSYLSLIIPLLLLNFIFVSPASTLFKHSESISLRKSAGMNDIPVFLLIFDEISGLTLQSLDGRLDESRYPGFKELAAQADYFPNALTVGIHTSVSVPSIASGNLRIGVKNGLLRGENLIDLFRSRGTVDAYSTVLPADLMTEQSINRNSLASDFVTLYVHILSHKNWIEDKIGVIPQAWKGFGVFFNKVKQKQQNSRPGFNPHAKQFIDWMEHINNAQVSSRFNFLHIQFPHAPYMITSLGRSVLNNIGVLDAVKVKETFKADQTIINVSYHNYMQQSVYVDQMLLEFVAVLKKNNLFDKSLVIVTSDHGVSYNKTGVSRREIVNNDSWKNIVSVPLFIKYPYQNDRHVNSSFVTTLDISTTIMNVVGIDSPWESVGENLKEVKDKSQTQSVKFVPGYEQHFKNINDLFQQVRDRKETLFSDGGLVRTIAVNYTENPVYTALLKSKLTETNIGFKSNLKAVFQGRLNPEELSYYGTIYDGNQPADNRIIAAVVAGKIQAIFESGEALHQVGFFAFSLPENKVIPTELNVLLYEVKGEGPFKFRKIGSTNLNKVLKNTFSNSTQKYPYDWKNSVISSHGLDELNVRKDGVQILSSKSNDPYIVLKSVSQNAIDEPIFHIKLESNRELVISLYYQTSHLRKFDGSQRVSSIVKKGHNSIYIKIPDKNFIGPFRIDTGIGGETEVLLQELELRN